jgi:hypothetical protein
VKEKGNDLDASRVGRSMEAFCAALDFTVICIAYFVIIIPLNGFSLYSRKREITKDINLSVEVIVTLDRGKRIIQIFLKDFRCSQK